MGVIKKITGNCHCERVGFAISIFPDFLVECNCSICRRLAALWGHVSVNAFKRTGEGQTIAYSHGEKNLAIHSCAHCGCTTHWENLMADGDRMAVNFKMCEPTITAEFKIRQFDGADSWEFLDE